MNSNKLLRCAVRPRNKSTWGEGEDLKEGEREGEGEGERERAQAREQGTERERESETEIESAREPRPHSSVLTPEGRQRYVCYLSLPGLACSTQEALQR